MPKPTTTSNWHEATIEQRVKCKELHAAGKRYREIEKPTGVNMDVAQRAVKLCTDHNQSKPTSCSGPAQKLSPHDQRFIRRLSDNTRQATLAEIMRSSCLNVKPQTIGTYLWHMNLYVRICRKKPWLDAAHRRIRKRWARDSVSNGSGLPGFGPGWTRNRGPGPGQEPPRNGTAQVLAGCYPDRTYTCGFLAGLEPDLSSNCTVPTTLAAIKYLSSDRIMTWWICRLSNSMSSFTSSNHICDPTDIRRVAVK